MTSNTAIQIARRAGLQLMEDNATHRLRFYISGSRCRRRLAKQEKVNKMIIDIEMTLNSGITINAHPKDIFIPQNPFGGVRSVAVSKGTMWTGQEHITVGWNGQQWNPTDYGFRFSIDAIKKVRIYKGMSDHDGEWKTIVQAPSKRTYKSSAKIAEKFGRALVKSWLKSRPNCGREEE